MQSNAVLEIDGVREASPVEVRDNDGHKGVFARVDIPKSSIIFQLKGTISTEPTKYTIQLGSQRHLNSPDIRETKHEVDYCWRFLNHSCDPNGYLNIAGLTLRALRNIAPGEEITFNYLTTESEMAVPFQCVCGAANCFGFIQGRNFLSDAQAKILPPNADEDGVVSLFPSAVAD